MVPDSSLLYLCRCCRVPTMSFLYIYTPKDDFKGLLWLSHVAVASIVKLPSSYPKLAVQSVVLYSAYNDRTLLVSGITCLEMPQSSSRGTTLSREKSPVHGCYPCLLCWWVINTLQTTHISLKAEDYHKVASLQCCSCNNKQLCYPAAQKGSIN